MIVLESDYEYDYIKDTNNEEESYKTIMLGTKYKQV